MNPTDQPLNRIETVLYKLVRKLENHLTRDPCVRLFMELGNNRRDLAPEVRE